MDIIVIFQFGRYKQGALVTVDPHCNIHCPIGFSVSIIVGHTFVSAQLCSATRTPLLPTTVIKYEFVLCASVFLEQSLYSERDCFYRIWYWRLPGRTIVVTTRLFLLNSSSWVQGYFAEHRFQSQRGCFYSNVRLGSRGLSKKNDLTHNVASSTEKFVWGQGLFGENRFQSQRYILY